MTNAPTWIVRIEETELGEVQAFTEDDAWHQACVLFPGFAEEELCVTIKQGS